MLIFKTLWLSLCAVLLTACASGIQSSANRDTLDPTAKWALLPIANNTDTPQAGLSAEAMVEHQLRRRGIVNLQHYPQALSRDSLFEPTERKVAQEALKWASEQGVQLVVMGSVEEWRYKVGIDGEPAVGITLKVVNVPTGQVMWSGSAAKSGWSREALSAVAQSVLAELLGSLPLTAPAVK
jgi:hypothetical protein